MKLSIPVITYNHEKYIAKALDSILMQRGGFEYEIVVGDDCSTDGTCEIIREYERKYPDRIRVLPSERNRGASWNCDRTLRACSGEYIALLDGDDYWTSPEKIRKQVELLDAHPEYTLCFHNVTNVYLDGSREAHDVRPRKIKEFYTVEELLEGNFIPNCSVMFRRGVADTPDWLNTLSMSDWPHHILCAVHGAIGYLDEVMAVHVFHTAGVWYTFSRSWLKEARAVIEVYEHLKECMEPKYREIIDRNLRYLCLRVAEELEASGDRESAGRYLDKCLEAGSRMEWKLFRVWLGLRVPCLFKIARYCKRQLKCTSAAGANS